MNDWFNAEHHVERAHEHFEAGRWDEAESELRRALELNPFRAEWHFNLGLTLEAAGRWHDSIKALECAHALEQDELQTILLLGMNHLHLERYHDALFWFNKAETIDATRADAYIHRIEAYTGIGDHEHADSMFYQALHTTGDHAMAYSNIAESLLDRGLYERAVFCLREAAAIDPGMPRIHARLAYAYSETGRSERARQLYLRELQGSPGDIDTLLDFGCLLIDMNRLTEASEKFRRVLEIEPQHPDAHFFLGNIAAQLHRYHDAQTSYDLVLRIDPDYPGVRLRLAAIKLSTDRTSDARKLLGREMRDFRNASTRASRRELTDLASLLLDARMHRDATAVLEQLAAAQPNEPRIWQQLSAASFGVGDRVAGTRAARKVVKLDPSNTTALHNLALASVQDGQYKRAAAYLAQAFALDADDPGLRRVRMLLRIKRAMSMLRSAISISLGTKVASKGTAASTTSK